jgi:hypothetical protein
MDVLYGAPLPWVRSGPGMALDGKPRFNLEQFDEEYFSRLRSRVTAAREKGIFVSVMLFGGYVEISEWAGNPFNRQNNINAIDGDLNGDGKGDTQLIPLPVGVDAIQKAYVRKVIDTLSDLENVLFEISNESEYRSLAWQSQLISYIKDYQSERIDGIRRKQHPIGITAFIGLRKARRLKRRCELTKTVLDDEPKQWCRQSIDLRLRISQRLQSPQCLGLVSSLADREAMLQVLQT